jgi:hypothetical protein
MGAKLDSTRYLGMLAEAHDSMGQAGFAQKVRSET